MDGILLHQIVHWHNMASAKLPPVQAFTGQLLLGWGGFNLVEGVIDHHVLELHHVRDLPLHMPVYDWVFLIVGGLGFIVAGRLLSRKAM